MLKVDVDKVQSLAARYSVRCVSASLARAPLSLASKMLRSRTMPYRAMPTFLVLKGTDKIDEVRARALGSLCASNHTDQASEDTAHRRQSSWVNLVSLVRSWLLIAERLNCARSLRALVQRHLPAAAAAAASAPGPSTGEGSSSTSAAPAGMISLLAEVVSAQATCLNELSTGKASGLGALLSRSKDAKLESDADAQLLLQLPLRSALRIRSVRLRTAAATDDADDGAKRAPRTIKLFVNRPALGFEDAESDEPAQEIELTEKQATKGGNVELRFVRFQNVSHLSVRHECSSPQLLHR